MTRARSTRHARQASLVEIGEAGQAKIAAASVDVLGSDLTAEIEARYLAGAGVRALRVRDASLAAVVHAIDPEIDVTVDASMGEASTSVAPFDLRDASARAVAVGAHRALVALRKMLA